MADLTLAPPPYHTVLDNAGNIVPNACIWTYVAGTSTPAATYSDALGTPNTNPIRADSAGRYTAYLVPGAGYAFVFEQPATPPAHGAVIRTADPVVGALTSAVWTTGPWLPGVGGSATYFTQEGTWVRVGPLVFARGSLQINAIGTGTPDTLGGLPFTSRVQTPIVVGYFDGLIIPTTWVGGLTNPTTTTIALTGLQTPAPAASFAAILGNGSRLYVSVVYATDDP